MGGRSARACGTPGPVLICASLASPGYAGSESLPRRGSQLHGCLAAVAGLSPLTCPNGGRDPCRGDHPLHCGQCPEPSRVAQSAMARGICSALA